jgi:hypothetical protein
LTIGMLAMTVVAGCTTTSQGKPIPATSIETTESSSPSSGGQDLPFAGAPKVDDPLDTTRFQQDPCQALTANQVTTILGGSVDGKPTDRPLGNACQWRDPDSRGLVEVHFSDQDPRGLSALYQASKDDKYAYFTVLPPIEGYPAVARDVVDDRDIGRCSVVVGVSDEITFDVPVRLSEANAGKDPCDAAVKVAGMALQTMKNG